MLYFALSSLLFAYSLGSPNVSATYVSNNDNVNLPTYSITGSGTPLSLVSDNGDSIIYKVYQNIDDTEYGYLRFYFTYQSTPARRYQLHVSYNNSNLYFSSLFTYSYIDGTSKTTKITDYLYTSNANNYVGDFFNGMNLECYKSYSLGFLSPATLTNFAFTINVYEIPNAESIYNDFYQEGYNQNSIESYNQGYTDGQSDGYDEGQSDGYGEGYSDGYDVGRTDGYTQGYNTALSTHDFSFTNLFASLSDTPVLMIRRLFGFEIFGVSLIAVFMSLFTALVIIKIIKKVF